MPVQNPNSPGRRVQPVGRIRWRGRYFALLGAVALLTGCGNAYQHLTMGDWREVGQAEPPMPPAKETFVATTLDPGEGLPVQAGDLVKAVVTVTRVSKTRNGASYTNKLPPQAVWVWTGREPPAEPPPGWDFGTFGMMGDPHSRAIFIGRRLHEQLELQGAPGYQGNWAVLPARVFIDYRFSRMHGASSAGHHFENSTWPELALGDNAVVTTSARIEILEICRGAKLYRRTATLTQYGLIFGWGDDSGHQNKRHGTLGWSALEAKCPEPDGRIRFQAGPFYDSESQNRNGARLDDWQGSYETLRPPDKHPEEWGHR